MQTWKEVVVGLEGADYVQLEDGNLCDKRRWVASEVVRSRTVSSYRADSSIGLIGR